MVSLSLKVNFAWWRIFLFFETLKEERVLNINISWCLIKYWQPNLPLCHILRRWEFVKMSLVVFAKVKESLQQSLSSIVIYNLHDMQMRHVLSFIHFQQCKQTDRWWWRVKQAIKLLDREANKPIGDLSSNLPPQLYTFTAHQWPIYNKGKETTFW